MSADQCSLSGLTKHFDGRPIVQDVSLDVKKGEFVVILGPSGCGKTTTLRMIAGLENPDQGRISIGGRAVSCPAERVFVRPEDRGIGMVFQSYAIWPHMSVFQNVAYPLKMRGWSRQAIRDKVEAALEIVGLGGQGARPATALSGGQMQRVALARALVFDPALLLFDEPLSNLDLKLRERLRIELKAMQQRTGITSIYVTHDQTEAVELGDRVVVMQAGRIVQAGRPEELYDKPRTRFVAEFIGSANIFAGAIQSIVAPGLAEVRTDHGQVINGSIDGDAAPGDAVDIIIHPEDCRLSPADAADGVHRVKVLERRYQGVVTRYRVDWQGLRFDVVTLGTAARIVADGDATLHIDRARLIRKSAS